MKRTNPITRIARAACFLALLAGAGLTVTPAHAQRAPGQLGIGGQLGSPSGLTLKVYRPATMSYDFLAAWDMDDAFFLNAHGLFERHLGTRENFHFFYGPGAFIGFRDRPRDRDDDVLVGISGSFGLNYVWDRFEVYGQLTPRLGLVPDTDGDFGGGLGFRFYF